MEYKILRSTNDYFELALNGKIDTTNSEEIYKKLSEFRNINSQGAFLLNLEEIDYISSSGLRVLMRLLNDEKNKLILTEVTPDIYEIFEMTGFDNILEIKKAYKRITVEENQLFGVGTSAKVYRLNDELIVKVFESNVSLDRVDREREISRKVFVKGIQQQYLLTS